MGSGCGANGRNGKRLMQYKRLDMLDAAGKGYLPTEKPLIWALQFAFYPLATPELVNVNRWYPVAFAKSQDGIQMAMPASPVAGKSVLISSETGRWIGKTFPFFLKQFPFQVDVEIRPDGKKVVAMMIADNPEARLSTETERKIFGSEGKPTPFAKRMIKRMTNYDAAREIDRKRIALLEELELFVPWELNFEIEAPVSTAVEYLKIDEQKLMNLADAAILELHKLMAWRMIYGHLFSLHLGGAPAKFYARLQNAERHADEDTYASIFEDDDELIEF